MVHAINLNSILERRRRLRDAIEGAIDALDRIDGDADLEDDDEDDPEDGREPALGWTLAFNQAGRLYHGGVVDAEHQHDGREPSLGSCSEPLYGNEDTQEHWAGGNADDREGDHDDLEPDADGEPEGGL